MKMTLKNVRNNNYFVCKFVCVLKQAESAPMVE
jgi:hypothetical protein